MLSQLMCVENKDASVKQFVRFIAAFHQITNFDFSLALMSLHYTLNTVIEVAVGWVNPFIFLIAKMIPFSWL